MNCGIIDIGSNTIRLVVYRIDDGRFEYLIDKKIFVRAVTYKEKGHMKIDGVKVIIDALNELKELAGHHTLTHLWCFATASLRGIDNTADVLASIREGAGLQVDILSGEQEAELGVAGLRFAFDVTDCISIDLGGGSCEVTLIRGGSIAEKATMNMGSVSISRTHVSDIFPSKKEIERIRGEAARELKALPWLSGCGVDAAYAMGGSARAMCSIHKAMGGSAQEMHGYRMFTGDIDPLCARLIQMELEGIRLADQYCPGRIFTLIPGMIILQEILLRAGVPMIRLSRLGVREGYLLAQAEAIERA